MTKTDTTPELDQPVTTDPKTLPTEDTSAAQATDEAVQGEASPVTEGANPAGTENNAEELENAVCRRTFEITIPAEVVTSEIGKVTSKFQKEARLPGFRKGKVPVGLIRGKFAKDIKTDVLEHLVPQYLRTEIEKEGLTPVSQPRITDLKWNEGEPAVFTAVFEVLPEIQLADYTDLAAERPEINVPEEAIEAALHDMRENHASFDPVEDGPLGDGDFAQVSFTGTPIVSPAAKPGGLAAQPVSADEVLIEIGGQGTVEGFSENLRGATPGEERVFDVTYPPDFADKRLAGATMQYTVQIRGIKSKTLPELNDEFAKMIGEFESLDALKDRLRQRMAADRTHEIEHEAKEKLIDELLQRNPFPAPQSMVEHQIDLRLERGFRALVQQGMRVEDIKKMDIAHLRGAQREAALREVRSSLLLDKIAQQENIEASDEELNHELDMLAAQSQQTPESVRARLTRDGALDRLRERLRNEKTLDFLYRGRA